jgi:cell division protein FtsN
MKSTLSALLAVLLSALLLSQCGPSPQDIKKKEQARQDSVKKVQQMAIARAKADSTAKAEKFKAEQIAVETAAVAAKAAEEQKAHVKFNFGDKGLVSVQVESWKTQAAAEKAVARWKNAGFKNAYAVIYGNDETGEMWYRVRLGKFRNTKVAKQAAAAVASEYNTTAWVDNNKDEISLQ